MRIASRVIKPRETADCRVKHDPRRRLDTGKDLRLGIGDRLDAGKEFQMHRLDGGNDCDMRPQHLDQRRDLPA